MKVITSELQEALIERTKGIIAKVKELKEQPIEALNHKEHLDKWSALECIEHLNLYGDYYNPQISQSIQNSQSQPEQSFKSGIIGNYFVKSMLPKEQLNKMKTFKDKNPAGSSLGIATLDRFISQQDHFLKLIEDSKTVSLNKTKTAISISRFIKLKLGDTFRFIVAHNERHLIQAGKALHQG